jgi:hypothetical protein
MRPTSEHCSTLIKTIGRMRIGYSNVSWLLAVRFVLKSLRDMVLSTCSSLITVVNVYGSPVIQFSHFPVKEYLISNHIAEGRVSRYYIPLEPAHLFVTQACLSILLQLQLDEHVTTEHIDNSLLGRYAGQYWTDHAEFGNVSSDAEYMIKASFDPKSHHFSNWVWIFDTIAHLSRFSVPRWAAFHRPGWAPLHMPHDTVFIVWQNGSSPHAPRM